jgi:hypothetical protein
MPMLQVTVAIGKKEMLAAFEARVVVAVNALVGNYSTMEHKSCMVQLWHGRLNRVLELADVRCRPRPELIAKKYHAAVALAQAPSPQKVDRKKRRKASFCLGGATSEQEGIVVKPVKLGKDLGVLGVASNPPG